MGRRKILIHGVTGRMGRQVLEALCNEKDMEPTSGVAGSLSSGQQALPNGLGSINVESSLSESLGQSLPDVIVDFTNVDASIAACRLAAPLGVNLVVGTTGLSEENLTELDALANQHKIGIVVAPNFALGAVLLIHLARGLGKYFDYADIVETHHEAKIDSPSGTALALARSLKEGRAMPFVKTKSEKETLIGARGADHEGVAIHSVRTPGRMAHHEIVLGAMGQTLVLRHDTINRECYMPGVILAIRESMRSKGLVVGLEAILGLK
jgi:4-hydroxy-tetrahydrodipicolinate reductase